MKPSHNENVIGAMVLALSDTLVSDAQRQVPQNIEAAGLALIGHVPGISILDLSKGLGLSHPGTVRLVDRMEAVGLDERTKSKDDGRIAALKLTKTGKQQERSILGSRDSALKDVLSHLSSEEITLLSHISEKLLKSIVTDDHSALRVCRLCNSQACTNCPVVAKLREAQ